MTERQGPRLLSRTKWRTSPAQPRRRPLLDDEERPSEGQKKTTQANCGVDGNQARPMTQLNEWPSWPESERPVGLLMDPINCDLDQLSPDEDLTNWPADDEPIEPRPRRTRLVNGQPSQTNERPMDELTDRSPDPDGRTKPLLVIGQTTTLKNDPVWWRPMTGRRTWKQTDEQCQWQRQTRKADRPDEPGQTDDQTEGQTAIDPDDGRGPAQARPRRTQWTARPARWLKGRRPGQLTRPDNDGRTDNWPNWLIDPVTQWPRPDRRMTRPIEADGNDPDNDEMTSRWPRAQRAKANDETTQLVDNWWMTQTMNRTIEDRQPRPDSGQPRQCN